MSTSTKIFIFNTASFWGIFFLASFLEHRCGRCDTYTVLANYAIIPIVPFIISMIGVVIARREKSRFGFWSNLLASILPVAFLCLLVLGASSM